MILVGRHVRAVRDEEPLAVAVADAGAIER